MLDVKASVQSFFGDDLYIKARQMYHRLRILSSPLRSLPDFIIVGTAKGGTTSLYAYLTSHPQVLSTTWKEVGFFDINFSKKVRWYRRHFPLSSRLKRGTITGEATPYYLYHPYAAKRIASVVPNIKIIALLRNPVDRAISHYWHNIRSGLEDLPMHEAFEKEKERLEGEEEKILADESYYSYEHHHFSYLDRGIYVRQIERYLIHFDQDQILILKSEDLFQNTQIIFEKVVDFLGINPYSLSLSEPRNTGTYRSETEVNLRKELEKYFQPYNQQLYEQLGIDLKW